MLQANLKIESLLFNYETTYKTDYRFGDIHDYPKTEYKARPSSDKHDPPAYKDINTMTEWKGDRPSFSLTHAPKQIIRTHPNHVQQRYEKHEDSERELAQKTRPRLVMTPAVSMDDIAEPRTRSLLCADMYTSNTSRAAREAVAALPTYISVKAPLPETPAPSNPVRLINEDKNWAELPYNQIYCLGNALANKDDSTKCRKCDESAIVRTNRIRQRQCDI